jgi:apolipoprotein N-acyltransferase
MLSPREVRPALPARWAAPLVVVSGLAGVAAFPRLGWWPLAFVSIAGFSVAVHGQSWRRASWLGYLYGWAFFGLLLTWTGTYVGPVWLLLPFMEAAFFGLLGAALTTLQRLPAAPALVACAWVGQEALRDRLPFGGFPWGRWAFSQADSPLRWFAALGGAPLVTAAVAFGGAGLWQAIEALRVRQPRTTVIGVLATAGVFVAAVLVWLPVHPSGPAPQTQTIALIQGDVPDRGLEFNARRRQVLDNHVQQTLNLVADIKAGKVAQPSLVVWPENASDIDPFDNPDARAEIEKAVRAVGVPILVGAILDGDTPTQIRNVGILWSPTTGPGAEYVKRHPVPFGEYMPFRSLAEAITSKAKLVQDMVAGHGNGLLTGGPFPIGDVICFEVAYDSLVRSSVNAGARLIVVQTNNATFGHSWETYQQLAMARLRAVEHHRTVVQVATSGKSAIIDPSGHVVAESGALFTPAVIVRSIGLYSTVTLADRVGEWPEWTMTAIAAAALAAAAYSTRRRRSTEPPSAEPTPTKESIRS